MQAKCPQCSNVFETERTGVQFCPRCGQQVNVAETAGAAPASPARPIAQGARCAKHPDVAAVEVCSRCGSFVCGQCVNLQGALVFCPTCFGREVGDRQPTPWERRQELGLLQGLWQTSKLAMLEPQMFWRTVSPTAPWKDALWFAWCITAIEDVVRIPFAFVQSGQITDALQKMGDAGYKIPAEYQRLVELMTGPGGTIGLTLVALVIFPITLFINAGLIHLFGLMSGAAKHGYGATLRAVAYASVPLVFAGIPVIGIFVGFYFIVLEVWAIMRVQETTVWRALFAVIALPVLFVCCACGVGIFAVAAVAKAAH